jgi:hypothetical protein
MSRAYAIDVQHQTAGLVVGEPGNFRFFSSSPDFDALEGRDFPTLAHVNSAARELAATRPARRFGRARR